MIDPTAIRLRIVEIATRMFTDADELQADLKWACQTMSGLLAEREELEEALIRCKEEYNALAEAEADARTACNAAKSKAGLAMAEGSALRQQVARLRRVLTDRGQHKPSCGSAPDGCCCGIRAALKETAS